MLTIPPWNVNSGGFTKYVVQQSCSEIFTREVGGAASTGYIVQTLDEHGNAASTYTVRPGDPWIQKGVFRAGDKPFQVQTVSGSISFDGYEIP